MVKRDPILVSVAEARGLLGVGHTTVYSLISTGVLPSLKNRASVGLIPLAAIEEFVASRRSEPIGHEITGLAR